MKKRIILYGWLKKLHPEVIEVCCNTAEEAVRYLQEVVPALKDRPLNQRVSIQILGVDCEQDIRGKALDEFHIMPAFTGAGLFGNFFKSITQIAIGAVLIVAGIYLAPTMPFIGQALIGLGSSMVLGGLMSFISPQPGRDSNTQESLADPEASKYLGQPGNTTKIGTRIPIAYGIVKMWGHYLSFDVSSKDVALDDGS